ncbi:phospholipid/cholesterol/gamma-HCH transport system substrate-binding protein [Actinopolyspora mzabensis]|uniref:Phospholipid/cholesterol/gamma-HCH transport system substrate-binding protein n=1 Tax=Actinopolyspora mzabensis TaxID=995066 RepID=A0A1G8WMT4_ACTMZ|nr:MCE family protein [Actinopolyspora mzabensis]SDJ78910.1 phospholipid/cholesterol/gamma-HCH transport system substrate-binding protein [Actinopolyspora mzabensis]
MATPHTPSDPGTARTAAVRTPTARFRPLRRVSLALLTTLLVTSGCGLGDFNGVHSLPLPGGADVGDDPYTVKARFDDVTDLVPNAGVRVNDVPVGRVSDVELVGDSWRAEVTMTVHDKVDLPGNALAKIEQSSLLGEKYVELYPPPDSEEPKGELGEGDVIPNGRTGRGPEVEEVLGALAMLLNGGGIAQIQNIAEELNKALDGREAQVRDLLSNMDQLVGELDESKDDITAALDSVNRLSATLREQRGNIESALRDLEPGLKVLNRQRQQLVTMLESLDKLSGVATDVIDKTRQDILHNLRKLQPVLRNLAAAGSDLPKSLQILFTYPFTDAAVKGIKGDYTNLYMDVDLNLSRISENLGRSRQPLLDLPGESSSSQLPDMPLPLTSGSSGQSAGSSERSSGSAEPGNGRGGQPSTSGTPESTGPSAERDESSGEDDGGFLDFLFGGD